MKSLFPKLEHRAQAVIPAHHFMLRLACSVVFSLGLIAVSLVVGMVGYHVLEGLAWMDAFLNASMLLGGMGPVTTPVTDAGKLFAGIYALYCGVAVLVVTGVILAPIAHRILHRFHVDATED